jgi:hypothetical protein
MVERCSCRVISLILRKNLCNLDYLSHLHATQQYGQSWVLRTHCSRQSSASTTSKLQFPISGQILHMPTIIEAEIPSDKGRVIETPIQGVVEPMTIAAISFLMTLAAFILYLSVPMTIWKRQEFVKMLSESHVLGHLRFVYGLLHALTVLALVDTLSRLYFSLQDVPKDPVIQIAREKIEKQAKLRLNALLYIGILYLGLVAWSVARLVRNPTVLEAHSHKDITQEPSSQKQSKKEE